MKQKFSISKIGKYLREISVIVIGVAITLSASYGISIRGEKRDMALYLNAIKLELEENIETIERAIEDLKPSVKYSNYLQSLDIKSLNNDSIRSYEDAFLVSMYSFQTNAFEMFKNSGVMRLIDDKEFLQSLWNMHEGMIGLRAISDWYFHEKWSALKQEIPLLIDGQKLKTPPMYYFHLSMPNLMLRHYQKALRDSKEMVLKLEK
ncbi:MAG: hypothetical protein FWD56_00140 [Bacteroidales bacterium]|nr:hypothetical protein [Bacteroidales bacterium]